MQHSVTKEQSTKNAPTAEEIRKRAFEIHIERWGNSRLRPRRLAAGGTRGPGKAQRERRRGA